MYLFCPRMAMADRAMPSGNKTTMFVQIGVQSKIQSMLNVKDYGSHCVTIFQKSSIYSDPGNYLLPGDGDVNEMRM